MSHFAGGTENVAFLTLFFEGNLIAHIHVNWLAPVKVRRTLIGGSKKMIVYDDLEPSEKIKVYDKGVTVNRQQDPSEKMYQALVGYRTGDMLGAEPGQSEALRVEAAHFVRCVEEKKQPITDGQAGLRVVRILEAATESMRHEGRPVDLPGGSPVAKTRSRSRSDSMSSTATTVKVPFLDLKAQYHSIKPEIDAGDRGRSWKAASSSWARRSPASSASSRPTAGPPRASASTRARARCTWRCCAAGIGPGDEVITVPYTFVATVAAIRYTGARAGLRRHRPGARSPWTRAKLEAAITPRTRAIAPGPPLRAAGGHGPDPGDRPQARARR